MCLNESCKIRRRCYRHMATANEFRQAYSRFSPVNGSDCEYFWPFAQLNVKDVLYVEGWDNLAVVFGVGWENIQILSNGRLHTLPTQSTVWEKIHKIGVL